MAKNWANLLTAISALAIALAVVYAVVIQGATLTLDNKALGKLTVQGKKPSEPVGGATGAARPGTDMTVWQSECPEDTKPISGTCISQSGNVPLQNIGPAGMRWECAWAGPMPKANVQAVCLKVK